MITALHHIQLAMPAGGEAEAEAFYSGVLALERIAKPEHLAARGGCWFVLEDGSELHLGVEEPFVPARKAHPAFIVSDLADVRAAIEDAGGQVTLDAQLVGFDRFYAADPFGNRLEIMSPA